MYIVGFYGISDAGKTTLVEVLSNKKLQKYNLEEKRGITLKVNYSDFSTLKNKFYMLDHPGHQAWSIEAIRNVDLLDLAVYMFDASSWANENTRKNSLENYRTYMKLFKELKIEVMIVLNKCQTTNVSVLTEITHSLLDLSNYPIAVIPLSCFVPSSLAPFKAFLDIYFEYYKAKDLDLPVTFRTIKSFDRNPVGLELTEIIGGILGGYFYTKIDLSKKYYLKSKDSDKYEEVYFKKVYQDQKIGTLETYSDPCFYRNDSKKGSFLIEEANLNNVGILANEKLFKAKVNSWIRKPFKNEEVWVLLEGQVTICSIKKINKDHLVILKKDPESYPLYFKTSTSKVMIFSKDSKSKAQELLCIGDFISVEPSKKES